MNTCKHEKTSVTNSSKGNTNRIKPAHYDCFAYRIRKCDDCGENMQTVEIDRHLFEKLLPHSAKKDIIQDIIKFLNN